MIISLFVLANAKKLIDKTKVAGLLLNIAIIEICIAFLGDRKRFQFDVFVESDEVAVESFPKIVVFRQRLHPLDFLFEVGSESRFGFRLIDR